MAGKSKAISEDLYQKAKAALKKIGKDGEEAIKLATIALAKERGLLNTARFFGISRMNLTRWIKKFESGSVDALAAPERNGRKRIVSTEQENEIKSWIFEKHAITIDELREMIAIKLGLTLGRSTVHRLMKRLNFSYITPRPVHHKQNASTHEAFKKNSKV